MGSKVKVDIPTLVDRNDTYCTMTEKAEHLNNYFTSQSTIDIPLNYTLPGFNYVTDTRLNHIEISEEEINKVLLCLNVNKASGPDGVCNIILKNIAKKISKPLSLIFNKSLCTGVFPDKWKLANVVPLHKKNDRSVASNYRPVSLT